MELGGLTEVQLLALSCWTRIIRPNGSSADGAGISSRIDGDAGGENRIASDVDVTAVEADSINRGRCGSIAAYGAGFHEVAVLSDGTDRTGATEIDVGGINTCEALSSVGCGVSACGFS